MKKYICTLAVLMTAVLSWGQAPSQRDEIVAAVRKTGSLITCMECDFVQTRTVPMMQQKMTSSGKMYFRKPSCVRWEYISPVHNMFIINGDKVLMGGEKGTGATTVKKNRMLDGLSSLIVGSLSGDCLDDQKTFSTEIVSSDGEWIATLIPTRRELKQMWSSLVIRFDPATCMARGIVIEGTSGDRTEIIFSNVRCNGDIPEDIFRVE